MKCAKCDDTGSLSKDLHGYLDCPFCEVADERTALDDWASFATQHAPNASVERWLIYQHGKTAALNT
jgi:hypothetical protein